MAIRITERKPLIKPDWYNEKEREMNLKNQVITNEDSSQNSKQDQNIITSPEELTASTSSVKGKRGTENIGIAVFDGDKLCGELTAVESICHLLIQHKIDSCIVSVNNPIDESKKIELQLYPTKKPKISVDIKDNVPHIYINIALNADILTLEDNINYQSDEILNKISDSTKKYLENELKNYTDKVSKEYGTDIDHFCTKAFGHFATIPEWKEFNWTEKYKNANFHISIDTNVISSLLITKT